ncbi:Oxysterol-binding protein-domain-containing protein [Earliella scabrosa]|nr:Oxysterol-binding protein-domain-containing protein [Earliella scabrosa]
MAHPPGALSARAAASASPHLSWVAIDCEHGMIGLHPDWHKWYLKANHPVEASRWITALQKSMELAKRESEHHDRRSGESETPSLKPSLSISSTHRRKDRAPSGLISNTSSAGGDASSGGEDRKEASEVPHDQDEQEENEDTSDTDSTQQIPPHANSFELQGNALLAQVELASQLLSSLPKQAPGSPRAAELNKAIDDTFTMVKEREEWYKSKLERERERQNIWEESLQAVVREGDMLERELRSRFRRRSRALSVAQEGTVRKRPSQLVSSPSAEVVMTPTVASPTTAKPESPGFEGMPSPTGTIAQRTVGRRSSVISAGLPAPGSAAHPFSLIMGNAPSAGSALAQDNEGDTDEEDEFFDAIEANTLPNLVITKSLIQPAPAQFFLSREVYAGYLKLRDRLSISSDDRPPTSLWAVLKNSIGKDLTEISFPVFFNEPTSMLQRMAEDMEFSECLDAAYAENDPHRRIAFVAAFAIRSIRCSYVPVLLTAQDCADFGHCIKSETFEYVRHDKQYRYVSEQVSHHPPISACWTESPMWRYYGKVDAQNKFMGKSFEIRPTGIAHAELLLPEERAPDYPKAKGPHVKGRVVEHYSRKKVTTNISGFILGSPTIDHYGDMVITNHRTGDQCVLTFKPRGWRGKDAFEISGYVADAHGNVMYEITGRWNSQLVARQVGTGVGQLHPDVAMDGPNSPSASNEYILPWRNSVKPPSPFNLTPFAITLNDCPEDTFKPYIVHAVAGLGPDAPSTIVRIPATGTCANESAGWQIKYALDAGARGIVVPMVNSSVQAAAIVAAARFPPQGVRGFGNPFTQLAWGPGVSASDYLASANDAVLVLLQIETREGMQNLEEILSVDGVDGVFIGPYDLSLSHGFPPPSPDPHPEVEKMIQQILAAAHAKNKKCAIYCISGTQAARRVKEGFDMINVTSDSGAMADGLARHLADVAGALEGAKGLSY